MATINQLLIIDDDPVSRQLMVEAANDLLQVEKIITCASAFSALTHIRENCMPTVENPDIFCPELILLDITMPVIDGYGFLAELHRMEGLRHKNTSVLFVSAATYEKQREKAKFFPVLGYIEKPLTSENLCFALKNILPISNKEASC